jgi:hypothetical protein
MNPPGSAARHRRPAWLASAKAVWIGLMSALPLLAIATEGAKPPPTTLCCAAPNSDPAGCRAGAQARQPVDSIAATGDRTRAPFIANAWFARVRASAS